MNRKRPIPTDAVAHGLTRFALAVWRQRRQRISWLLDGRPTEDWTDRGSRRRDSADG